MGTSNSNSGLGGLTPLVPSWLGEAATRVQSPNQEFDINNAENEILDIKKPGPNENVPAPPADRIPIHSGQIDRFTSARKNFTQFVKSDGKDRRKLGKSITNYVKSSNGGAQNASKRMGSSRKATANLINFFSSVQSKGAAPTLESLNLSSLVGKSIDEVFLGLTDYICPDGGSIDEGIARSAFIETIAELAENGIVDIDSLTTEQMQTVLEIYATHSIEERLCNDIGTKICIASSNIQTFEKVQAQLLEFIRRSISDAFIKEKINLNSITSERALSIVDKIYETAFRILENIAEEEAEAE